MPIPTRQERSQCRRTPVRHVSLRYGTLKYSVYFMQDTRKKRVRWYATFGSSHHLLKGYE